MNAYSEDPKTISLYPEKAFEEDLTLDIDEEIAEKCEVIRKATKGSWFLFGKIFFTFLHFNACLIDSLCTCWHNISQPSSLQPNNK